VPESFEKAVAGGARDMILVMPNAFTAFQGSFYSSSVTTGDWEGFVARDLVAYVDSHYRTLATRENRGLTGHSMGGYGALRIAMKYPEVFSAIYAMSACCLAATTPAGGAEMAKAEALRSVDEIGKADFRTKATWALAAAWSPNPKNPPLFVDLPTKDGVAQPDIMARWAANAPLAMVDQYVARLKPLHLAIDVGDRDRTITTTSKELSERLNMYEIRHGFEVYDGDHVSGVSVNWRRRCLRSFCQPEIQMTKVTGALIVALAIATGMSASAPGAKQMRPHDVDALPSKPPDTRIPYGKDDLQFGELRLPKGKGPFPVAVVIHGGCWVAKFASTQNTAALADALRDAGIATWNVEYRRADNAGGGWPGTFADIAAATDLVRTIAREHPLDLTRVVTVGHSAGGHLALWAAARSRLPKTSALYNASPLPFRGAVALVVRAICEPSGPTTKDLRFGRDRSVDGWSARGTAGSLRAGLTCELLPLGVRQIRSSASTTASCRRPSGRRTPRRRRKQATKRKSSKCQAATSRRLPRRRQPGRSSATRSSRY
jgi:acetyl esterase/lipase